MVELINKAIDWEKLDSSKKNVYKINIKNARLSKENLILTLPLELNFVLPYVECENIRKKINGMCEEITDVNFEFHYSDMVEAEESYLVKHIENLFKNSHNSFIGESSAVLFEKARLEKNALYLPVLGDPATSMLRKLATNTCKQSIKKNFGIEVDVVFECDGDECSRIIEENANTAEIEMKELSENKFPKDNFSKPKEVKMANASHAGNSKTDFWKDKKTKEAPAAGNRIMGQEIKASSVEMLGLEPDIQNVVVEGVIFAKADRLLSSGNKKIVSLYITDKKTSICAKTFASVKKADEIMELLKEGDKIKICGKTEFDSFEKEVVVMVNSIEKMEKTKREDHAEKKRVELHAHTKMSAMDGLTEVADLVKIHADWGHTATAITDHGVVQGFPDAAHSVPKGSDMKIIYGMEGYVFDDSDCIKEDGSIEYKTKPTNHIILLARTQEGLKNLYKLVSYSHINYFYKKPRLPKSVIEKYRDGIIIGAACEAGEVYRAVAGKKPEEEIKKLIDFYDYLEIQPLTNNKFMIEKGYVKDEEELKDINRRIIELGKKYGKLTCATTDAHFPEPEAAIYRKIVQATMGYSDEGSSAELYLRTTQEMLDEFSYLGEELAYEVVVENTNIIADKIDRLLPVPEEKYPPKIKDADVKLREACYSKAHEIYGNPLPPEIEERLKAEIEPIIREGYAVMYIAAKMLVDHSLEAGYLVGSRGSVGSSFAATMAGITEVNPLPPHYLCPDCKHLEWGDENEYDCGVDMPDKNCPVCGTKLNKEGFTIPFQTFLGFEADKEPDIDLNFAGEYQAQAHKYVDEIFGAKNVYKAGTMSTVAEKSAYGMVRKYFDEKNIPVSKFEIERLTKSCAGVKKTTGQHPGGIIIVPDDHEIYEFCPVQRPANDMKSDVITTHYDYHSIDKNLLKLDILGHDVPSIIRHLQDMTGVDPVKEVPLSDAKVNSIFLGVEGLDIKIPDYKFVHGSYGIPEFGTKFTRQMLDDTKPKRFADLVRISGFSHGTDVWLNNAQEWIRTKKATMKEAISTRDDIMNYLILKGLEKKEAFTIMEKVRKGKGVDDEQVASMEAHGVPQWYIESCRRIKYMFPRAHAVAYVMMSYRIAYFKVYYPQQFYAAYFTTKSASFDANTIMKGIDAVYSRIKEITLMDKNASAKEQDELTALEVAYEMYARGYEFTPPRLGESDARKFRVKDGKVQPSFVALAGLGENAAKSLAEEFEKKPFETVEEIKSRAKINKAGIEALREHGVLGGLPETDQLCLF